MLSKTSLRFLLLFVSENSLDLHPDWAFSTYLAWLYWLTVGCGFIPEEKGEVMGEWE